MNKFWSSVLILSILKFGSDMGNTYANEYPKIPLPSQFVKNEPPWAMVRKLQHAQDKIAAGKQDSLQIYRDLLVSSSTQMLAMPNSVWQSKKNLIAAAVYTIIGGNPAVGEKAITFADKVNEGASALIAANAYANRGFSVAFKTMADIDHTKLPASAAAQFAMVKSMVVSSSDLEKAAMYLKEARRLAPGTLIEEAALRRSLRISGERREFESLKVDSNIYYRHFSKSKYFGDFLKNFAYGLSRMPDEDQAAVLSYVKQFLTRLTADQELNVLIFLARNATVSGRVNLAYWASIRALSIIDEKSPIVLALRLYAVASGIVQVEYFNTAVTDYSKIERKRLNQNDQRLYDAISALLKRLDSASVDLEKVKSMLQRNNQIFPGDEPEFSTDLKQEAKIIAGNKVLARAKNILEQAKGEVAGSEQ